MALGASTHAGRTRRGIGWARTVRFFGMADSGKYVAAAAAGAEVVRVATVGRRTGGGRGPRGVAASVQLLPARGGGLCVCCGQPDAPELPATAATTATRAMRD